MPIPAECDSILRDEGLREVSSFEGIFFMEPCIVLHGGKPGSGRIPEGERSVSNAGKKVFYIRISYGRAS